MNAPDKAAAFREAGDLNRSTYLGGSDAAALFGVSPWTTPLQLYEKKIAGELDVQYVDPTRTKFFRRRKRQEPVIAEMLAEDYGVEVTRLSIDENPNRYVDAEHGFFAAEIDFEFPMSPTVRDRFPARDDFNAVPDGTICNGEIKTVHPFKAAEWGEEGSEEIPIHYAAQVMWGLGITRRPAGLCAALFGLDNLVCYPVMADQETIAAMRARAYEFWTNNVEPRVPPDPVNLQDIKSLYGRSLGRPVDLDMDAYQALLDLDLLRSRAAQAKKDQEEAEWRVAKFIADQWRVAIADRAAKNAKPDIAAKDNAALFLGDRKVGTWNSQRGCYLDQKRLAVEKPEIVGAYNVEHFYRVFRLTKEKSK